MTTTRTKAAAWRRAANILLHELRTSDSAPRALTPAEAHILAAIVPSLVRRAEIIERRRKVGR